MSITPENRHALSAIFLTMKDTLISNKDKEYHLGNLLDELDSYFLGHEGLSIENSSIVSDLKELQELGVDRVSFETIQSLNSKGEYTSESIYDASVFSVDMLAQSTPEHRELEKILDNISDRAELQANRGVKQGNYKDLVTLEEIQRINEVSSSGPLGEAIINTVFLSREKEFSEDLGISFLNPNIYKTGSVPSGIEDPIKDGIGAIEQRVNFKGDPNLEEGRRLLNESNELQDLFIERERDKAKEEGRKFKHEQKMINSTHRQTPFVHYVDLLFAAPGILIGRAKAASKYKNGLIDAEEYKATIEGDKGVLKMKEFDRRRDQIQSYQNKLLNEDVAYAMNDLDTAKKTALKIEEKIANGEDYSEEKSLFMDSIDGFKKSFDNHTQLLVGAEANAEAKNEKLNEDDPDYITAQNSIRIMLEEADKAQEIISKSSDKDVKEKGEGLKEWLTLKLDGLSEAISNGIKKVKKMLGISKEDEPKTEPETP